MPSLLRNRQNDGRGDSNVRGFCFPFKNQQSLFLALKSSLFLGPGADAIAEYAPVITHRVAPGRAAPERSVSAERQLSDLAACSLFSLAFFAATLYYLFQIIKGDNIIG